MFHYSQEWEDPVSNLRTRKAPMNVERGRRREQPPWFNKEMEELSKRMRTAGKQYREIRNIRD